VPANLVLAAKNQFSGHLPTESADGWRYLIYGIWERFDTLWYLHIAANGYDRPAATVFYPLYPFLIHCVSWLTRDSLVAALMISTVACFFMLWGLQELTQLDWPGHEVTALVLFAAWPSAFIFMAAYPESLVIALAVWSIYFARTDRWWLAGILACLAGLTKATGVMVAIPLLILLVRKQEWKRLPALVIAPLGFVAFNLCLRISGFPSTNAVYAKYWNTEVAMPWRTFFDAVDAAFRHGDWLVGLNVAALIFCIAVIAFAKGLQMDYLLFSAACLILFLTKYTQPLLQSTVRYVLFVFPVFLYSASWIRRRTTLWIVLLILCPFYFAMLRTFLWWGLIV
jgi:hypothetical protein